MNENAVRRRQLGRQGEELAAMWYEKRGFDVVARNWSCRAGELDIVACKGSQGIARAMVNKIQQREKKAGVQWAVVDLGTRRELERLLTLPEAAAYLGISKRSVYRLIQSGRLRCATYCSRTRVPESALADFVASHQPRQARRGRPRKDWDAA